MNTSHANIRLWEWPGFLVASCHPLPFSHLCLIVVANNPKKTKTRPGTAPLNHSWKYLWPAMKYQQVRWSVYCIPEQTTLPERNDERSKSRSFLQSCCLCCMQDKAKQPTKMSLDTKESLGQMCKSRVEDGGRIGLGQRELMKEFLPFSPQNIWQGSSKQTIWHAHSTVIFLVHYVFFLGQTLFCFSKTISPMFAAVMLFFCWSDLPLFGSKMCTLDLSQIANVGMFKSTQAMVSLPMEILYPLDSMFNPSPAQVP